MLRGTHSYARQQYQTDLDLIKDRKCLQEMTSNDLEDRSEKFDPFRGDVPGILILGDFIGGDLSTQDLRAG